MNSTMTRAAALAATAMGVILTTPAYAQEAADENDGAIIVTARRIEERLQDVPISITVFNQEQLSNRNISNTGELAAYTPSLAVNNRYGPDKASFVIRGFSQELNTLPTVGVYFAEVSAPRLSSNITSGNGVGPGMMFDLANVQVLKGPQGTLFGKNTTGGAVLLVPEKPKDRFEGFVEGTIGNFDARRVQAVINVPLSDTFKVRAGVDRYKRDGYIKSVSGIGPKDFSDIDYISARLSIVADLTPDLENYTIAMFNRSDTNGTVGRIAYCHSGKAGTPGATAPVRTAGCDQFNRWVAGGQKYREAENNNPNPFVVGRQWGVINTTTWKASDTLTIKNIASYAESKERYSFSLNGDNFPTPFVTTYPGPGKAQGNQYTLIEELQLQGRSGDDKLIWQVGGYLEKSSPVRGINGQEQYTAIFAPCTNIYAFQCNPLQIVINAAGQRTVAGNIGVARNVYFYRNYGLYAQATYKFTDQLSLTGGIRNTWDWQKEYADNIRITPSPTGPSAYPQALPPIVNPYVCSRAVTPVPNPGAALLTNRACTRTFVEKSSEPTWLINLDFKPSPDILIFAKYARGYRGGGINEANVGAETWNPEFLDNYELGFKGSFRSGDLRASLNVVGFWNEFRDQQATVVIPQCTANLPGCTNPAPTGINGIQNIGKSRTRGVEVDGSLTYGGFSLDYGYAYLDAVVKKGADPICDPTRFICANATFLAPGQDLPFTPKHRVTLTGTYTLPLDESLGRLSVSATMVHTAKQIFSYSNALQAAAGAIPYDAGRIPKSTLITANLNWREVGGSPIDVSIFSTNLTNKKYRYAITNSLATTGSEFVIVGEPRMYGLRVKYRFGD